MYTIRCNDDTTTKETDILVDMATIYDIEIQLFVGNLVSIEKLSVSSPSPHAGGGVATNGNELWLIASNYGNNTGTNGVDCFDMETETFRTAPALSTGRVGGFGAEYIDGLIYMVGGYNGSNTVASGYTSIRTYDPLTGEIVDTGLRIANYVNACSFYHNGYLYTCGSDSDSLNHNYSNAFYKYDLVSKTRTSLTSQPWSGICGCWVVYKNTLYQFAQRNPDAVNGYKYNFDENKWYNITSAPTIDVNKAFVIGDKIYVITRSGTIYTYNPDTDSYSDTGFNLRNYSSDFNADCPIGVYKNHVYIVTWYTTSASCNQGVIKLTFE